MKTLSSPNRFSNLLRQHGFLLGLLGAVILGFLLPQPGSQDGVLKPQITSNIGIALILLLQGMSLAIEKVKAGASNWRLHLIIQSFTFVIFPLLGVLFNLIFFVFWPTMPRALQDGFLYLCVLPSTISTSVVLTAIARGNTAGALFNAALSNILGVILTPILVHFLMQRTGEQAAFGPLLLKVSLLTLLPFTIGMFLRPKWVHVIEANKRWNTRICNAVILFIVYTAFCDSVQKQVWNQFGWALTAATLTWVILLFLAISVLSYLSCRIFHLNRADSIAAYFCSVKKTLAMGVPLAMLIFGNEANLTMILLPILFFHPLQLLVNGILASYWAKSPAGAA